MPRTDEQKKTSRQDRNTTRQDRPLKAFRLLAGQHIGRDHAWEPPEGTTRLSRNGYCIDDGGDVIKDPETDRPLRWASKTYNAGEVVLSDVDLVDLFGHQKFEALDEAASTRTVQQRLAARTRGDVTPLNEREAASRAPHGQVSTGRPETGTTASGLTSSGSEGSPATEKVVAGVGSAPTDVPHSDDPHSGTTPRPGTEAELKGQSGHKQAAKKSSSELDRMSTADLRKQCEEEEVDVPKNATREQMLRALKSS